MKKNSILLILAIGMMSGGFYNDIFAVNATEQTAENQQQGRVLTREDAIRPIREMKARGSTELVIPEGYTSIGKRAFVRCKMLTSVDFKNVKFIERGAFQGCTGLTSIDFKNVKSIERLAFEKCTGLTSIDLKNVESIEESAFNGCTGLKSIDLKNVESIGRYAFEECTGLTSIDFKNVKFIGRNAFKGCTGLTSIDFKNVKSIGDWAFYGCTDLTSIDLQNVQSIGEWAFSGCTRLTSIVIPDSITKIGWLAFSRCYNLKKVCVYSDRVKALVIASSEIDPDIIEVIEKPKDVDSGMALHHQYLDEKAKLDARVKQLHDKKIADRKNNPEFVDLAEVKSEDGQWLDRDVQKDDEERIKKKIARLKEVNERNKK